MYIRQGEESKVGKLSKPLYRLIQSGREWYKKLDGYITNNGGLHTVANPCVSGKGDRRVITITYVDDLILTSRRIEELEKVKSNLKSAFKMEDLGPVHDILGINVKRENQTAAYFFHKRNMSKNN